MSYVGEPFQYDVFFSYAYAEKNSDTEELKAWSQRVATRITKVLKLALNAQAGAPVFEEFLDKVVLESGAPLMDELEEGARGSAILVALITPFYGAQTWCQRELEWFLDQARQDGRNHEQTVLIMAMPTPKAAMPNHLIDAGGEPYLTLTFHDGLLPYGLIHQTDPKLDEAVATAVAEAASKLQRFRDMRAARARQQAAVGVPQTPTLYLDQGSASIQAWLAARTVLGGAGVTVFPTRPVTIAPDDPLAQQASTERLKLLEKCDGLVVLRTAYDIASDNLIMGALNDANWLIQNRSKVLPWAVLDDIAGGTEEVGDWVMPRVPRISAAAPNWPSDLIARLRDVAAARGSPP